MNMPNPDADIMLLRNEEGTLYVVYTHMGATIMRIKADDDALVEACAKHGRANVLSVRPAKPEDVDWHLAMGGWIV